MLNMGHNEKNRSAISNKEAQSASSWIPVRQHIPVGCDITAPFQNKIKGWFGLFEFRSVSRTAL